MDQMTTTEDIRKAVFEASGFSAEVAEEVIHTLKKRLGKKKHLPEMPSMHMIEMFLIMNKFNIDVAQAKLEMYYQVKTEIPEIFHDRNPASPHMQKIADVVYLLTLPKLTPELYRVNMLKMKDTNPKNINAYHFAGHMFNIAELNLVSEKYALGEVFVYDLEGASLMHMFNFGMNIIRKLTRVLQEVYSPRMKGIHFVNCPSFMSAILAISKAVLKKKLAERIYVHKNYDTLTEFIPACILPKEYGGQGESLDELREIQRKQLQKYRARFDHLDRLEKN